MTIKIPKLFLNLRLILQLCLLLVARHLTDILKPSPWHQPSIANLESKASHILSFTHSFDDNQLIHSLTITAELRSLYRTSPHGLG